MLNKNFSAMMVEEFFLVCTSRRRIPDDLADAKHQYSASANPVRHPGGLHIIKLSFACLATKKRNRILLFVAKHAHGFGVFYVQSRAFKSQKGISGDQETTVRGGVHRGSRQGVFLESVLQLTPRPRQDDGLHHEAALFDG